MSNSEKLDSGALDADTVDIELRREPIYVLPAGDHSAGLLETCVGVNPTLYEDIEYEGAAVVFTERGVFNLRDCPFGEDTASSSVCGGDWMCTLYSERDGQGESWDVSATNSPHSNPWSHRVKSVRIESVRASADTGPPRQGRMNSPSGGRGSRLLRIPIGLAGRLRGCERGLLGRHEPQIGSVGTGGAR
ncbi:beta/gamma crystallin-related protein [Nocardia sp. NPDC046763]|uniref:beta/gamma crystallin-related protein n=1 Tax=Nocardia sp. NPDC046763 TaxID=3155256 RepID=UPI0034042C4A